MTVQKKKEEQKKVRIENNKYEKSLKRVLTSIGRYAQYHWGKADDRNCNYGHPKMADMKLGKNLFCRLNCFYNVF